MRTFYSNDGKRISRIMRVGGGITEVDLYERGAFVRTVDCSDHSIYWAEDVADNWCTRVIRE